MSTTAARQAYRPSYRPASGTVDVSRPAGRCDCGLEVTVETLFSHDCPNDSRTLRTAQLAASTGPSDSLDVPEWRGGAAGHAPRRNSGPSPKQVNWLLDLYAKAGEDATEKVAQLRDGRQASQEIDRLRAKIDADNAAVEPPPCKPNRYPGPCRFCGADVPAGQGLLCGGPGNWAVEHKDGDCSSSQSHTAASPAPSADVAAGHYAIQSSGANDLVFYRVDRPTEGAYAGRTFVKMIVGGHPDQNVRRDHVAGILGRIAADPDAATRYGQEIGRCHVCNRSLTDETSRQLGIGPECRKHQ